MNRRMEKEGVMTIPSAILWALAGGAVIREQVRRPWELERQGTAETRFVKDYQSRVSNTVNRYLDAGIDPELIITNIVRPEWNEKGVRFPVLDDATMKRLMDSRKTGPSDEKADIPDYVKGLGRYMNQGTGWGALAGGAVGGLATGKFLPAVLGAGAGAALGGYLGDRLNKQTNKQGESEMNGHIEGYVGDQAQQGSQTTLLEGPLGKAIKAIPYYSRLLNMSVQDIAQDPDIDWGDNLVLEIVNAKIADKQGESEMNGYIEGYMEKNSGWLGSLGGASIGISAANRLNLLNRDGTGTLPGNILSLLAIIGAATIGGSAGSMMEDAGNRTYRNWKRDEKEIEKEEKSAMEKGAMTPWPTVGRIIRNLSRPGPKGKETPEQMGTRKGDVLKPHPELIGSWKKLFNHVNYGDIKKAHPELIGEQMGTRKKEFWKKLFNHVNYGDIKKAHPELIGRKLKAHPELIDRKLNPANYGDVLKAHPELIDRKRLK